jgi:hypothetical protein
MKLLNDIHHLAFLTDRVFEARVTVDLEEEGRRHAFIEVGSHTVLHPFQVPGVPTPAAQPMFKRGRLDRFALNAASEDAFRELRRRVIAQGAGDGVVTDMRSLLTFGFTDPDGGSYEVAWAKPGVGLGAALKRVNWRKVEIEKVEEGGDREGA